MSLKSQVPKLLATVKNSKSGRPMVQLWLRGSAYENFFLAPNHLHYARGFISEITCTWADWLANHESLYWHPEQFDTLPDTGRVPRPFVATAQPLERLRLTTWPIQIEWLDEATVRRIAIHDARFYAEHGLVEYKFVRVKCPQCEGHGRIYPIPYFSDSEICPECKGVPLNEWTCDAWPGLLIEMPTQDHRTFVELAELGLLAPG